MYTPSDSYATHKVNHRCLKCMPDLLMPIFVIYFVLFGRFGFLVTSEDFEKIAINYCDEISKFGRTSDRCFFAFRDVSASEIRNVVNNVPS